MSGFDQFINEIARGNVDNVKMTMQDEYLEMKQNNATALEIAEQFENEEIIQILRSTLQKKQMVQIVSSMGVECNPECDHTSCLISRSLDDLKKSEIIYKGEYGNIFKVTNNPTQFHFVMKIIKNEKILEVKRYLEININLYRDEIIHQRIVRYFGAIVDPYRIYLFMEYVDGCNLTEEIQQNNVLDHAKIARYSKQILEGVSFLHSKDIIHRDIKPGNIMLDQNKDVKLIDFGLSRSLKDMNTMNTFCGTSNYMAPEIMMGKEYDSSVDIWSMGVTVIEMLTGKPPYSNISQHELIKLISTSKTIEFPRPNSESLNNFIDMMLKAEPKERPTAVELLQSEFITQTSNGQRGVFHPLQPIEIDYYT